VDPLDDEDLVVELDFADGVATETTVSGGDVSCFERTPERAGQSTGGGRHDIVEGGGVGFEGALGGVVVGSDGAVDPEGDGVFLCRQMGVAQGALGSFDVDLRAVHDFTHGSSSSRPSARPRQSGYRSRCRWYIDHLGPAQGGAHFAWLGGRDVSS
jgi:hypothetical protein